MITYRYLSDGTKVSAEAVLEPETDEGDGIIPARIYRRRYKGNFTYVTDPDTGEETLESIAWNEGMIYLRKMAEPSEPVDTLGIIDGDIVVDVMDTLDVLDLNNRMIYDRWFVKDHLGNVRTVVELGSHSGEIVEQDDYLPFGTRFTPATQGVLCLMDTALYGSELDNRYRYAGKEEQRFGNQIDLGLLDFGARSYDPFTARWTSVDPLAHKYLGLSPYNYCGNNPVIRVDSDGKIWETLWDVANVILDAQSLKTNIQNGNVGAAVIDGLALAGDAFAALVPIVPAGLGIALKAEKGVDKAVDISKAGQKTYQTYVKENIVTGEKYVGRTSGNKTAVENVRKRDSNHHMNEKGFGPAKLDKSTSNPAANRGREQFLIDQFGGAKSSGGTSGNAINGISPKNPNKNKYYEEMIKEYGKTNL